MCPLAYPIRPLAPTSVFDQKKVRRRRNKTLLLRSVRLPKRRRRRTRRPWHPLKRKKEEGPALVLGAMTKTQKRAPASSSSDRPTPMDRSYPARPHEEERKGEGGGWTRWFPDLPLPTPPPSTVSHGSIIVEKKGQKNQLQDSTKRILILVQGFGIFVTDGEFRLILFFCFSSALPFSHLFLLPPLSPHPPCKEREKKKKKSQPCTSHALR